MAPLQASGRVNSRSSRALCAMVQAPPNVRTAPVQLEPGIRRPHSRGLSCRATSGCGNGRWDIACNRSQRLKFPKFRLRPPNSPAGRLALPRPSPARCAREGGGCAGRCYSAGMGTGLGAMGMAAHPLEHQPHRLEMDGHHHLQGHQGIGAAACSAARHRSAPAARRRKLALRMGWPASSSWIATATSSPGGRTRK